MKNWIIKLAGGYTAEDVKMLRHYYISRLRNAQAALKKGRPARDLETGRFVARPQKTD